MNTSQVVNFYEILGVPPSATHEEIKRAYLALVKKYHPDVNPSPGAEEVFLRIQEAYTVLSNPRKRSEYDRLLAEQALHNAPITIRTTLSRNSLSKIDEPQLLYALVEIAPRPDAARNDERPRLNVCLLLDRSTSMKGKRLEELKRAASLLVDDLREDDIFSVVAFDDRAEVIASGMRGKNKEEIRRRIGQIQARGATEIYRGLLEAYKQIGRSYSPDYLNAIIMLTDGHTYGDEHKCERLARQAAKQGIIIHGLGLGTEWNDTFLDKITSITGGSASYVRSSKDVARFLTERLHGVRTTFAQKVELDFAPTNGVRLQYAFRLAPSPIPLSTESPLRLGALPREAGLRVIFEFMVDSVAGETSPLRLISGVFKVQSSPSASEIQIPWHITLPIGETAPTNVPSEITDALARLTLYRLQEEAKKELAAGNAEKATRRLENLATRLLQSGNVRLAMVVKQEAARVKQHNSLSPEGEKEIKFGTRALLLPPSVGEEP